MIRKFYNQSGDCGCGSNGDSNNGVTPIPEHLSNCPEPSYPVDDDPECIKGINFKCSIYTGDNIPEIGLEKGMRLTEWLDSLKTKIVKPYKEFAARLFQQDTSGPSVQNEFINEISIGISTDANYRFISFLRISTGIYQLRITSKTAFPLTEDQIDVSFSDAKVRQVASGVGTDTGVQYVYFNFNSYTASGTLSDNVIAFTNIYIRQFIA